MGKVRKYHVYKVTISIGIQYRRYMIIRDVDRAGFIEEIRANEKLVAMHSIGAKVRVKLLRSFVSSKGAYDYARNTYKQEDSVHVESLAEMEI